VVFSPCHETFPLLKRQTDQHNALREEDLFCGAPRIMVNGQTTHTLLQPSSQAHPKHPSRTLPPITLQARKSFTHR